MLLENFSFVSPSPFGPGKGSCMENREARSAMRPWSFVPCQLDGVFLVCIISLSGLLTIPPFLFRRVELLRRVDSVDGG